LFDFAPNAARGRKGRKKEMEKEKKKIKNKERENSRTREVIRKGKTQGKLSRQAGGVEKGKRERPLLRKD